jgi:hypothetical protein
MNRYILITAVIATVLIAMVWNPQQLTARLQRLAPLALDGMESVTPTPTPVSSPTPEPPSTPEPSPTPTPEAEQQPSAKCLDGSPLTVTSSDSNQTNYRCGSGAIGAYTN